MPGDDGLRLDDDKRRAPSGPEAREHNPDPAVRHREADSRWAGALPHVKVVPQGQDFELEHGSRTRRCPEGGRSERSTEVMAEQVP